MNAASAPPRVIGVRSTRELLIDVSAGANRIATGTRSWPTFAPTVRNVDEMSNAIEGLRRLLGELRGRV